MLSTLQNWLSSITASKYLKTSRRCENKNDPLMSTFRQWKVSRNTFIPAMPALTRCAVETKLHDVFRKNEKHANLQRINSQVGMFSFLCKFDPVCFVLYYISSAEEAIQNMHGAVIGKQTVRISCGKTLANRQITRHRDHILRYGGMYALALAYAGTSNSKAIRQLLHFVVSDVSDDVRRTVVLSLGFVLYSKPPEHVDINEVVLPSLMLNLRQKVSETQKEQKLTKGWFFFLLGHGHGEFRMQYGSMGANNVDVDCVKAPYVCPVCNVVSELISTLPDTRECL
ncbi:26S proteasome non-ATPase regulatory subunit 1 homolog A [Tanacetum coccineum]